MCQSRCKTDWIKAKIIDKFCFSSELEMYCTLVQGHTYSVHLSQQACTNTNLNPVYCCVQHGYVKHLGEAG